MSVCPLPMCLVPMEASRGHQMPRNWCYQWLWVTMWVPGIKPRYSARAACAPNHWAIPPVPRGVSFNLSHLTALRFEVSGLMTRVWKLHANISFFLFFLSFFWNGVSLSSPGCPWTHYVDSLALNSQRPALPRLLSAGATGLHHHHLAQCANVS